MLTRPVLVTNELVAIRLLEIEKRQASRRSRY
jgi:hypothetical protein